MTKLERFMDANRIDAAKLARESCMPLRRLRKIMSGQEEADMFTAMRIRDACGRLLLRQVKIGEVFGLGDLS